MAPRPLTSLRSTAPGVRDIASHALSWASLAAYSFVTSTIVFRSTGQADYGVWATIAAFRSALMFLDGGLAFGVTRDASLFAAGDGEARSRLHASYSLYLGAGLVVGLLGALLSWVPGTLLDISSSRPDVAVVTMLIGVETGLALAAAPANATLRGLGRFGLLAAASGSTAIAGTLLLVVLTPGWGLVGAGAAVLAGRLVGGLIALAATRLILPLGSLRLPTARGMRRVSSFALPLWAAAIGSAIGVATDVPIVGALFGADAAGAYGVGAVIPSVVAGLIFVLLDTAYPRLATLARASIGHIARLLTTAGAFVAAMGLGAVAISGQDLLTVWLGQAPDLAIAATVAYAAVWLLNVPAHVLVLSAVARDQHYVIGRVVVVESIVNLILSLLLAHLIGPVGPAIATVATIGVSNGVVLPVIIGRTIGVSPARLLIPALAAVAAGLLVAFVAWIPAAAMGSSAGRIAVHALLVAIAIAAVGTWVISKRAAVQRLLGVVFDGGWRVLRAERAERTAMSQLIASDAPRQLRRLSKPLVTIRIATYNRGPLVAERAIASALAQSYSNIEVVVVGDHCDEATEAAVRAVRDHRVRFENLPRRGAYPEDPMFRWMVAGAAPMNRALELARGEWIAPLDDDDEFTADHIEVLLDACLSRGLHAAYGRADTEVRPGEWQPVGAWPPKPGGIVHASVLYSIVLRPILHSSESWRLNEPGDWNLWRRMIAAGARFGFVDRVVVKHYLEYREVLAEAVS